MKTKSLLILSILISIVSMNHCIENENDKNNTDVDIESFLDDWENWDYNKHVEQMKNTEEEQEEAKEMLKDCKDTFDDFLEDTWEEIKDGLPKDMGGLSPEEFEEVQKAIQTIDENLTNIPRLLLLFWIQLETYANKTIMNSPYGPTIEEKTIMKNVFDIMRVKLLHLELMHNDKLTNIERLKIFNKMMKRMTQ